MIGSESRAMHNLALDDFGNNLRHFHIMCTHFAAEEYKKKVIVCKSTEIVADKDT